MPCGRGPNRPPRAFRALGAGARVALCALALVLAGQGASLAGQGVAGGPIFPQDPIRAQDPGVDVLPRLAQTEPERPSVPALTPLPASPGMAGPLAPLQAAPSQEPPSQKPPSPATPQAAPSDQAASPEGASDQAPPPYDDATAELPRSPILIVNRNAVLEQSAAGRALQETERATLEHVTEELEKVRAELQAEEQELTDLKETLPPETFEARARAFDKKVRAERMAGQDRRAVFQKFTQDARSALASALPRVLEAVRQETGALAILDSTALAAADSRLDITAFVIRRYDEEMGEVRFDPPEGLLPR